MYVPSSDTGQYWWLKNTGASPEDMYIEEICNLLDERPKGTAVDVGANFGCWTLPLTKHAHHVVAIEPQSGCFKLLSRSLRTNKYRNVTRYNFAVGDQNDTSWVSHLDLDKDVNFGGVSIGVMCAEHLSATPEKIEIKRLDDLLHGFPVSFIKVDVEGFEQKVLAGARETIMRCKPILFAEMDHPYTIAKRLKEQIENMGYVTDKLGGNYLGMPI